MRLDAALAEKYLSMKTCPHKNTLNKPCKSAAVMGACKYHMTEEQHALATFVKVFERASFDHGAKINEEIHKERAEDNAAGLIGRGHVTHEEARRLAVSCNRRCGRPKRGLEGGNCRLSAEPYVGGCKHHLTPAEQDATVIAFVAFNRGYEIGQASKS